ncbi:hypothetical protein GGX14DRAFT_395609 [Mycena pura]|uniref:Uncharacterized protein n=1 Tax=Mycena pura TaxID=153505 RepID=A0AAD6VEI3_9AGAR|nr:hypothetical protein GGX14DRAFT_395609 [Mycena pura]
MAPAYQIEARRVKISEAVLCYGAILRFQELIYLTRWSEKVKILAVDLLYSGGSYGGLGCDTAVLNRPSDGSDELNLSYGIQIWNFDPSAKPRLTSARFGIHDWAPETVKFWDGGCKRGVDRDRMYIEVYGACMAASETRRYVRDINGGPKEIVWMAAKRVSRVAE